MKILLDECMPAEIGRLLIGHEVAHVHDAGFTGMSNGNLLRSAQHDFDVLLTVDHNLPHQNAIARFDIAVMIIRSRSNRIAAIAPFVPAVLAALPHIKPGTVTSIE